MKKRNLITLLSGWLALADGPARAAEPAESNPAHSTGESFGTITGRVQNIVSGRYLHHARVSLKNSDILVLTDEYGNYRLTRVPGGTVVLKVFYTGLDPQEIPVQIPAGQTITRDISLTNAALYGMQDGTVRLDPFTVASTRETDGAMIAINEQRHAANIKNVVSTDAFGDVVGGNNIADLLKFIPGIQLQGGTFEPENVFVRGFPANLTVITADGAAASSTGVNGNQRTVALEALSINNYSRVEVTKVPTPSTGADTMAGSVNLVSKNAFERSGAEFKYQVNLTGNSKFLTLKKTPFRNETNTYKINPGFTFDYTRPVNKNFGIIVSGSHSNVFFSQDNVAKTYTTSAAGTTASISAPFLSQHQIRDNPRHNYKTSVSLKADWRVTPHSVLSFSGSTTYSLMLFGDAGVTFTTGTNATSTIAGGAPFSFGPDFTSGATGRGSVSYGGVQGSNRRNQSSTTGIVRYTFDDGDWRIEALASPSLGKAWLRTTTNDTFSLLTATIKFPVRVVFTNIDPVYGPGKTQVFNNANQEVDPYDPNNFNLTAVTANTNNVRNETSTGSLDVRRRLDLLPFPTAVQVGARTRVQTLQRRPTDPRYTYQGPNGDQSSLPFLSRVYGNQKLPFNNADRVVPHLSSQIAWQKWQANPALFIMTPAQQVASEIATVGTSEYIKETVPAFYIQTEARLFKNRLNVVTGVRYEKTTDEGLGALQDVSAVWVRNPDGSFANNAAGARIRRPDAGAVGSMQEAKLIYTERGFRAKRTYDGYYPSLHLTYNVTEKLQARAAYAKTYGRPNYSEIIPNAVVNENDADDNDPNAVLGTINVRNTGLRPWSADNYDFSLEYYTAQGGLFGASVFHKEIKDFFGTFAKVATAAEVAALGLGPEYAGWQVNTRINAGDASVSGMELSMNHSLRLLGSWGQYFRMFANVTKLELEGSQQTNFTGFLPKSWNSGITFSKKPFILMAKLNYRGEERRGAVAALGPDAFEYYPARTHVDLSFEHLLRPNFSVFVNARNVTNIRVENDRYGSQTPAYARTPQFQDYGVPFSVGVKGSF